MELTIAIEEKQTHKVCGSCQLCCKLLPVRALEKKDNERCRYQKVGKGCSIHAKLETIAPECRVWNCRWLVDPSCGSLQRPDRSHYVIDTFPDFIAQEKPEGKVRYEVVQVWVDPGFRDAYREPRLLEWLVEKNMMALIRYSSRDAFVLVPPAMSETGDWYEHRSGVMSKEYETWPENLRDGLQDAHARYVTAIQRQNRIKDVSVT